MSRGTDRLAQDLVADTRLQAIDQHEIHAPIQQIFEPVQGFQGAEATQRPPQGGHHLLEFLTALVEDRDPFPNAPQSANITCTGILAHESAKKGGELIRLPEFTLQ